MVNFVPFDEFRWANIGISVIDVFDEPYEFVRFLFSGIVWNGFNLYCSSQTSCSSKNNLFRCGLRFYRLTDLPIISILISWMGMIFTLGKNKNLKCKDVMRHSVCFVQYLENNEEGLSTSTRLLARLLIGVTEYFSDISRSRKSLFDIHYANINSNSDNW